MRRIPNIPKKIWIGMLEKRISEGGLLEDIVKNVYRKADEWVGMGCSGRYDHPSSEEIKKEALLILEESENMKYIFEGEKGILEIFPNKGKIFLNDKITRKCDEYAVGCEDVFYSAYDILLKNGKHADIVMNIYTPHETYSRKEIDNVIIPPPNIRANPNINSDPKYHEIDAWNEIIQEDDIEPEIETVKPKAGEQLSLF